ncbi:glycosyltransferase family 4 protein [Pedobacter metabolipauper]|uniref:Glycosyltransferase involved in cell wall biosynthesis n=1 Tax=Pedobacter metabolipauper TaxID=425513 RepID=A0A4R6SW01_9SPHI|nr:glycosyltransferase family 4 protein [Pedobacter metabolipauper]TDQ09990.1 glycosyltransferase involved in cell wall biosynthesis [Pedobacter metabolipauper]
MKRLLVFSTQLNETGGIESHIREFCIQMTNSGIEIDLVVLNSTASSATEEFYKTICRRVFLGKYGRSYFRLFWLIRTSLICRAITYDAIYTNGQGDSIGYLMTMIGRKTKWTHHHHTSGDLKDQETWTEGYRKTLKSAPLIIACSRRNAIDMEAALGRSIDTIPCFSREIKNKAGKPVDGLVRMGYYGRLIPEKGIDLICRLSEDPDLKEVKFQIWGEGSAYPAVFFKQFPNLKYHGTFKGEAELSEVISSLDAFLLLTSHPEGLPICLLEAMSAGLPWLATDRGGIADIVCDPISTRMMAADSSFEQIKKAVLEFKEDLLLGKVSKEIQMQLYQDKFSATALVLRWKKAFNLN